MKTEAEIKEMRAAFAKARTSPCDCHKRGPVHTMQCMAGGAMMQSNEDLLSWVMGEKFESESILERILAHFRGK